MPPVDSLIGFGFASAVTFFLIRFLTSLIKDFKNTIDNHMEHKTEALRNLENVLEDNNKLLTKLVDIADDYRDGVRRG